MGAVSTGAQKTGARWPPGQVLKGALSAASIWEVTIKHGLRQPGFVPDPHLLRRSLLNSGYVDLPITSDHALAVGQLPRLHKDPFDRLLIAQATVEGVTLLTSDTAVAAYPGPIRRI